MAGDPEMGVSGRDQRAFRQGARPTLPFRVFRDGVESWMVEAIDPDDALARSVEGTAANEVTIVGTTYPFEGERRVWKREPFVIVGSLDDEDGRLYWSNRDGWGSREAATVFRPDEWGVPNPAGASSREYVEEPGDFDHLRAQDGLPQSNNVGTLSADYDAGYADGFADGKAQAVTDLCAKLSGRSWDSDTADEIATYLRAQGGIIEDVPA